MSEAELAGEGMQFVHHAVSDLAHRIPSHVNRSDLVSAGMLGLAQAARSYDPSRGVTFERFASARIRGALLDELRSRDWASRTVRSNARALDAESDRLTSKLGRAPTTRELAASLHVDTKVVHRITGDVHRATVLNYDGLLTDSSFESLLADDQASPEKVLLDRERNAYLTDAVAALPARMRRVVVGYYFEEQSMDALALELGVTDSRVSQLRGEAIDLLREGVSTHLGADGSEPTPRPEGRIPGRRSAYNALVGALSDFRSRVAEQQPSLTDKIAACTERAG